MKKTSFALVTIFIFLLSARTLGQDLPTTIKVQAMNMASAFMKNDFNVFVKFMHPNIIEFAGGKEQMKIKMDSAYSAMKRFGVTFKRYWIGSPGKIISYKDQLQSLLPVTVIMKTPLGNVVTETSMLVISPDKGKNWWFIDTNVYHADKLKDVLPTLSPELVIPSPKKPKIVRSQELGVRS